MAGGDAMTPRTAEAVDDLYWLEDNAKRLGLEWQVSLDDIGWQVRVRGHDPTGAYHEVSYTEPDTDGRSMPRALRRAAMMFCTTWGLA